QIGLARALPHLEHRLRVAGNVADPLVELRESDREGIGHKSELGGGLAAGNRSFHRHRSKSWGDDGKQKPRWIAPAGFSLVRSKARSDHSSSGRLSAASSASGCSSVCSLSCRYSPAS